ncbi:MAG: gluconate 2-dehydrogenase subunit 3 family protein [Candidatus Binatia bacterium]
MSADTTFSADQARVLDRALDEIIPASPDGRMPGAGELDLAGAIARALAPTPELLQMIVRGVAALEDLAASRHAQRFAALAPPEQTALLRVLESSEHSFPPILMLYTYAAYYQHPRIVEGFGLEARAPHPRGYEMAPNDLSLLDPVRRRGKMYREC